MSDAEEVDLQTSIVKKPSNIAAPKQCKMRRYRDNEKVDTYEEYYQYHRTMEESVDIFYNSDDDGEPHQSEFSLNLGDLVVSEKISKKKKEIPLEEGECSKIPIEERIPKQENCSESEFSHVLNISDILKTQGSTFCQFETQIVQIESFDFEKEIEQIKSDERFVVKALRPQQYLIDATKHFNNWNPDKIEFMETTVVIILSHIEKSEVNVIINSTIAENLSKHNEEFWKELLANCDSLWSAVRKITTELAYETKILFLRLSNPSELMNSPEEWTNQLDKNVFPNRFDHDSWTTASELLCFGKRVEWSVLTDMISGHRQKFDMELMNKDGSCGSCQKMVPGHSLFWSDCGGKSVCADCLKSKFYKELSIRKLPVELDWQSLHNYNILSTFVPLTVLNLYTRMCAEIFFRENKTQSFEKCQQCRSFLCFETLGNQSFRCPCGYCWCNKCKDAPHWPMTCEEHTEWKKKWDLRYNFEYAQGTGLEALIQVTCHCEKLIFYVRTPQETMQCPKCKVIMETGGMTRREFFEDYPWKPSFKRLFRYGAARVENYVTKQENEPYEKITTKLSKIPNIKASVIKSCKIARDFRFDQKFYNGLLRKEKNLMKKKLYTEPVLGNLISTSLYLMENVNAWMNETNLNDKKVTHALEEMKQQVDLIKTMGENSFDIIKELIRKLQVNKDFVIKSVKSKLKNR